MQIIDQNFDQNAMRLYNRSTGLDAKLLYYAELAKLQVVVTIPNITFTSQQQSDDEKIISLEFVILAEILNEDVDYLSNCKANSLHQQSHMHVQLNCRPDFSTNGSFPLPSEMGKEFCLNLNNVRISNKFIVSYCLFFYDKQ